MIMRVLYPILSSVCLSITSIRASTPASTRACTSLSDTTAAPPLLSLLLIKTTFMPYRIQSTKVTKNFDNLSLASVKNDSLVAKRLKAYFLGFLGAHQVVGNITLNTHLTVIIGQHSVHKEQIATLPSNVGTHCQFWILG